MNQKIAIIGAGMSGLTAAYLLSRRNNYDITVFEKARGVGGRMATRYTENHQFDFGAQYFSIENPDFKLFLEPFINGRVVVPWEPIFNRLEVNPGTRYYVANPKMTSLCKALSENIHIHYQTRIIKINKDSKGWQLSSSHNNYQYYDWVIMTQPAPQTLEIIPNSFQYYDMVKQVKMLPCYALMVGLNVNLLLDWDVSDMDNSALDWISIDSHKPNRPSNLSIVAHSSNKWAEENLDISKELAEQYLFSELEKVLKIQLKDKIQHIDLHKWLYANQPLKKNTPKAFIDSKQHLAICGDWCIQSRIESAFESAKYIVDHF